MKRCFKCGEVKALDEFYKHPRMGDGHLNKCKECTKKDVHGNREENLEYYREYDRKRANQPERVDMRRKVNEEWRRSGKRAEYLRKWLLEHPEVKKATTAVHNALRDSKLTKPNCCSECGIKTSDLEAHHPDYSKPLEIQWLCIKCHTDKRRRYPKVQEEQAVYSFQIGVMQHNSAR